MHDRPVTAMFPGSFDPITKGHIDVIERGTKLFSHLIIAVGQNPDKQEFFTRDERVEMIQALLQKKDNVSVESFNCLTVEFAAQKNAQVMLRGLRNLSDVEYEFQLAMTNRTVAGIETVFIMTSEEYGYVSSTMVRQIALLGGDVSKLIPPLVYEKMQRKITKQKFSASEDIPE